MMTCLLSVVQFFRETTREEKAIGFRSKVVINNLKKGAGRIIASLISMKMDTLDSDITFYPEDIVWADSCFTKICETSDTSDWSSFKEALSEILNPSLEPLSSFVPRIPTNGHLKDNVNSPWTEKIGPSLFSTEVVEDCDCIAVGDHDYQSEEIDDVDDIILRIQGERLKRKRSLDAAVISEDSGFADTENKVLGSHMISSLYKEEESTTSEIFNFWDLGVFEDVYELMKQIDKGSLTDKQGTPGEENDDADDVTPLIRMKKLKRKRGLENALRSFDSKVTKAENIVLGVDMVSSFCEVEEPSSFDIFKIWDLDAAEEVDKLVFGLG